MMQFGAQIAGLDLCERRVSYDNFLTSTPTKVRVCGGKNPECWEMEANTSSIPTQALVFDSDNDNSDPDTDHSYGGQWGDPPKVSLEILTEESDQDTDHSYGGQWGRPPKDSLAQVLTNSGDVDMVTGDEDGPVLPHVDSLALGDGQPNVRPHVDSLQLPPLGDHVRANLNMNIQVQFQFSEFAPPPSTLMLGSQIWTKIPQIFWTKKFVTRKTGPTPATKLQFLILSLISGQ